jgi:hypothetical protein
MLGRAGLGPGFRERITACDYILLTNYGRFHFGAKMGPRTGAIRLAYRDAEGLEESVHLVPKWEWPLAFTAHPVTGEPRARMLAATTPVSRLARA